jgi:proteasome beta subunit
VALPLFPPESDPGPDFVGLLRQAGNVTGNGGSLGASHNNAGHNNAGHNNGGSGGGNLGAEAPHATTVVALRFADGVIMAGDRRATMGNIIAHRSMEKVFAADRFSAVAIAGSAGMAVEMVRLFQVQLEHYEKVEGTALSLEGKANQLAQMVRQNLPLAMQGLVVVPLFAGYDTARGIGRIYSYDATGGHYEDTDFQATGSGGRDARSTIKAGYREGLSQDEAVDLAIQSLYDAADEDSATGGPDLVRGIYPLIAVVDAEGYRLVPEEEVAERFAALIARRQAAQAADQATRASEGGRAQ